MLGIHVGFHNGLVALYYPIRREVQRRCRAGRTRETPRGDPNHEQTGTCVQSANIHNIRSTVGLVMGSRDCKEENKRGNPALTWPDSPAG